MLRGALPPVLACCAAFLAVLLPFVVAAHVAPPGLSFRGTLAASGDETQYLAAVRQGMRGDWFWHDPYMVRTPPPVLMYPIYLLAGHLGAAARLSVHASYALLHACSAAMLVAVLWRLAASTQPRAGRPWFVACALGMSGLYWLVALLAALGRAPIPLTSMGTANLSGITVPLMEPHLALAVAGQLMALNAATVSLQANEHATLLPWAVYGGAGMILMGCTFPVLLPLCLLVVLAGMATRAIRRRSLSTCRRDLGRVLPIIAPALPFVAYYYLLFSRGAWATTAFRQVSPSPPVNALLYWGALLPLALWGWHRAHAEVRQLADLLGLWIVLGVIGTQLPFWQGPRFSSGLTVAIGGLFALGILGAELAPAQRPRLLFAISFGAVCHYLFLVLALSNGQAKALYGQPYEESAFRWIAAHASAHDIVLAPLGFSNVLPSEITGIRVVSGHEYQTLDYPLRRTQVDTIYNAALPAATRVSAMRATGATLVVDERLDDGLHYAVPPTPLLQPIYRNSNIILYRMRGVE